MSSFSLLRGLLLGTWLGCAVAPLNAQPQINPQPQVNPQQVRAQWLQLRRTWGAVELNDPKSAIDAYERFYNSLTDESGDTAVGVVSRVAQLYSNQLGQRDRALQIYQEAMERWSAPKLRQRLQREYDLINGNIQAIGVPDIRVVPQQTVRSEVQVAFEARAAALVELLAAGGEAESVWASQQWKSADVVWALAHVINDDGLLRGRPEQSVIAREALASLLAHHGGEVVNEENWRALPVKARLWLGDHYRRQNDGIALAVLQSVVDELEALDSRSNGDKSLLFAGVERLAQTYDAREQWEIAAQTWLRLPALLEKSDWRLPDALLGAARAYISAGDKEKSKALYAQVSQYGHAWFTGLAIHDQASALVSQGNHQEARQLLSRAIEEVGADQVKIALLSLEALSFYKTGDLNVASRIAQQASAQAKAVKLASGKGLEGTLNVAEAIQTWSDQWSKAPILMSSENLRLVLAPQESDEKMVTRRLFVRTLRDVPLTATVDDERIQVRVTTNKQENDYFVQTELALEVPQSLSQSAEATLTVSSPKFPNFQAKIPIDVEVPRPIQLSSSSVFFGEVKADEPTTRKLTLSAAVPFRVVDVKTDTPKLEVQSPATQAAKEHILIFSFTSPQVGRFESGTIRIQTDMPNGEVMEMPYIARVK